MAGRARNAGQGLCGCHQDRTYHAFCRLFSIRNHFSFHKGVSGIRVVGKKVCNFKIAIAVIFGLNYLTLDPDFLQFAECHYRLYDLVLLSNDVKEWSKYLFALHGLQKYFKDTIVSGEIHMRKPENRIFVHALERLQCSPRECIYVDNSVRNLDAAQEAGMETVLFNRDHEAYCGNMVSNFQELESFLKDRMEVRHIACSDIPQTAENPDPM